MGDSSSFLLKSDYAAEPEAPNLDHLNPSLDELIEQSIGSFSWPQFLQVFLTSLAWTFDAHQSFISVFSDAYPTWHCNDINICNSSSDICKLPRNSWAWNGAAHRTIISDWGLECVSSTLKGLPASAFFAGCLLGSFILSTLADSSLGRKNLLFLSCLIMSLSAFLTIFSTNIWAYSVLRFISGLGRVSIGTCTLVLSTELVGKKWRSHVATMGFFPFTLGFVSLPVIAYINKGNSWKALYLWTSIPAILYCALVFFFICESPRWLITQGRGDEAIQVLKRMGPGYGSNLDLQLSGMAYYKAESKTSNRNLYSSMKILFGSKWSCRRLMLIMLLELGTGMVYYGLPLGVGNLGFNIYWGVAFNALIEFISYILSTLFIAKWNRRDSIFMFSSISGIGNLIRLLVGKGRNGLQIGFELASFFSICIVFVIELVFTLELFPTCVRNSAMSMVRQATVFGAVFSPLLISAGRENEFLSCGVFGLLILFSGMCVFWLPETKGAKFSDTMEEQEHNENSIQ